MNAKTPSAVAEIILAKLYPWQAEFILKMKPHREPQWISRADWDDIEPCVDNEDGWPDVYWFGGMRAEFGSGRKRATRTFCFNEVGLEVRAILAARRERIEARRAETGNTGSVHESRVSAGNLAHPPAIQEQ